MKYYLAPLEGITGYNFRRTYDEVFQKADKYFIPFISPNQNGTFSPRERQDVDPDHNQGMHAVPQILTNKSHEFIQTAKTLKGLGYEEINLNLGCPSKTVVSKYRGSGFLSKTEELERFLGEIFEALDMKISIKTRIGRFDPEEFTDLMEIYNQYPVHELIIHPRIQTDYYKNVPNFEQYELGVKMAQMPVCYNGDIYTKEDKETLCEKFPMTDRIMLGRGILKNPALIERLNGNEADMQDKIKEFHDRLYERYKCDLSGDKTVLFKMKELWYYLGDSFTDSAKYIKKIRKAEKCSMYEKIVESLFLEQRFLR